MNSDGKDEIKNKNFLFFLLAAIACNYFSDTDEQGLCKLSSNDVQGAGILVVGTLVDRILVFWNWLPLPFHMVIFGIFGTTIAFSQPGGTETPGWQGAIQEIAGMVGDCRGSQKNF